MLKGAQELSSRRWREFRPKEVIRARVCKGGGPAAQ